MPDEKTLYEQAWDARQFADSIIAELDLAVRIQGHATLKNKEDIASELTKHAEEMCAELKAKTAALQQAANPKEIKK